MKFGGKMASAFIAILNVALLSGCNQIIKPNNEINEGEIVGKWPATEKLGNFFFECGDKAFFPVGSKWLANFTYDNKKKNLELVHLNAKVNDDTQYKATVQNDTIRIEEIVGNQKEITQNDVAYSLSNIDPNLYTLIVNDHKVDLDLRDINANWNYSLQENGALLIAMYDQEANADEK